MKNGIAQITTGQFAEFAASVVACLPRKGFNAQYYIENPSVIKAVLREAFAPTSIGNIAYTKLWWQNFYKKYFELEFDFSEVEIPDYSLGFDQIIIPMGLTIEQVLEVIKKKLKVDCPKGLSDQDIVSNDRNAKNGHYAFCLQRRSEIDKKNKDLFPKEQTKSQIFDCTLLEKLLMIICYQETGRQLDVDIITICSGSRNANGYVPCVDWCYDDSDFVAFGTVLIMKIYFRSLQ